MKVLKYKYRLYPTACQEQRLLQIAGSNRFVWNYFLALEMQQYQTDKKFRFLNKNSADLTTLKQAAGTEWLKTSAPATSLQQTLRNLDQALKQSFKRGSSAAKGFPKFKRRSNFTASFTLAMTNARRNILGNRFHVARGLDIKFKQHRAAPSDFATCQIKQESGYWFVVLTCKKETVVLPPTGKTVGIDLNSQSFVLSNGKTFKIPKYLKENQFKIKHLQRELSRKVRGSSNGKKAQLKLAKVHHTVVNKRLDYFHKLSSTLINDYDHIILEDLNVAAIQRTFGHVVKDNGFGMFREFIEYKAELYGRKCTIIDRWFPSSQLCCQCSTVQKMPLSQRTYTCINKACNSIMDRDLNAAINIQRAGTAPANAFGGASLIEQVRVLGILADLNEEGSHVL